MSKSVLKTIAQDAIKAYCHQFVDHIRNMTFAVITLIIGVIFLGVGVFLLFFHHTEFQMWLASVVTLVGAATTLFCLYKIRTGR